MESLAEASVDTLLHLTPHYDAFKQTFSSSIERNYDDNGIYDRSSYSSAVANHASVRHVVEKKIPAAHPPNAIGGGSYSIVGYNDEKTNDGDSMSSHTHTNEEKKIVMKPLHDTFTGLIDGITGEILHGTRNYILTGETYEGPFRAGVRHGDGVIVANVYLPNDFNPDFIYSSSYPVSSHVNSVEKGVGARFYGSYANDSPLNGTLVLPTQYIYHGPFRQSRPHGSEGTLVKTCGYKYEGGFRFGYFHGTGWERSGIDVDCTSYNEGENYKECKDGWSYRGDFVAGLRQGYGVYTSIKITSCPISTLQGYSDDTRSEYECKIYDDGDNGYEQDCASVTNTSTSSVTEASEEGQCIDEGNTERTSVFRACRYTYKGRWNGNFRQGEGEERMPDGKVYRGQFHADKRHGYGVLIFPFGKNTSTRQNSVGIHENHEEISSYYSNDINTDSTSILKYKVEDMNENELVSAEGIWRAGMPLDGTHGWTLVYSNGDMYTGNVSVTYCGQQQQDDIHFVLNGYGVKRYANKDVYSGEWKDNKRHGEGIFIAAKGKEEYIGKWKNDEILPMEEGDNTGIYGGTAGTNERVRQRRNLADVTTAILKSYNGDEFLDNDDNQEVAITRENEAYMSSQSKGSDDASSVQIRNALEYQRQRKLLEKIFEKSLSASLSNLEECVVDNKTKSVAVAISEESSSSPPKILKSFSSKSSRRRMKIEQRLGRVPSFPFSDSFGIHSNSGKDVYAQELENDSSVPPEETPESPIKEFITYPNGDTYLGVIDPDTARREGYGLYLSSASGSTFTGNFRSDKRHGYGILVHPLGKYVGDFYEDAKHGMGTLILNDASCYHGEFQNGAFQGRGTLCDRDGNVYVGDWVDGFRHGDGFETLADGRVYLGEYKGGKRHGVGTMLDKSGGNVIYSGSWREGLYHGEGVSVQRICATEIAFDTVAYHSSNMNVTGPIVQYEGTFVNGQRQGFGNLSNKADGSECKGRWHRNLPVNGKWSIRYGDGATFSGDAKSFEAEFKNDTSLELDSQGLPSMLLHTSVALPKPHGFGTKKYANGDIYIGSFVSGKRHGFGACTFANGDRWEGAWSNDELDTSGDGTLSLVDGTIHTFRKKTLQ